MQIDWYLICESYRIYLILINFYRFCTWRNFLLREFWRSLENLIIIKRFKKFLTLSSLGTGWILLLSLIHPSVIIIVYDLCFFVKIFLCFKNLCKVLRVFLHNLTRNNDSFITRSTSSSHLDVGALLLFLWLFLKCKLWRFISLWFGKLLSLITMIFIFLLGMIITQILLWFRLNWLTGNLIFHLHDRFLAFNRCYGFACLLIGLCKFTLLWFLS